MTQLTASATVALQLEMVRDMLPKMFPGRVVTANVHYRYSWEKDHRTKVGMTFWVAEYPALYLSMHSDPTQYEVELAAKDRMKRWHWKDKSGRIRKVKEILVVNITSVKRDPPIEHEQRLVDKFRLPLHYQ